MGTDIYVVITGEELAKCSHLPPKIAYLGCHFAGGHLTNIPQGLPEGSMLLIDDRNPPGDLPDAFARLSPLLPQLSGIYLDFQKKSTGRFFAEGFVKKSPIPVGTPFAGLGIPVFSARELHTLPQKRSFPFWQEGVLSCWELKITKEGCQKKEIPRTEGFSGFEDKRLFCRYAVSVSEEAAVFTFQNTKDDLLSELAASGAERAFVFYRGINS